jgi:hypothetical protein
MIQLIRSRQVRSKEVEFDVNGIEREAEEMCVRKRGTARFLYGLYS